MAFWEGILAYIPSAACGGHTTVLHGHYHSTKWKCFAFADLMGKTWLLIGSLVIEHLEGASFQILTGCFHLFFRDLSINIFELCLVVNLFTPQCSPLLNWDFNASPPAYPPMLLESRVKHVVKRELLVITYALIQFSNANLVCSLVGNHTAFWRYSG